MWCVFSVSHCPVTHKESVNATFVCFVFSWDKWTQHWQSWCDEHVGKQFLSFHTHKFQSNMMIHIKSIQWINKSNNVSSLLALFLVSSGKYLLFSCWNLHHVHQLVSNWVCLLFELSRCRHQTSSIKLRGAVDSYVTRCLSGYLSFVSLLFTETFSAEASEATLDVDKLPCWMWSLKRVLPTLLLLILLLQHLQHEPARTCFTCYSPASRFLPLSVYPASFSFLPFHQFVGEVACVVPQSWLTGFNHISLEVISTVTGVYCDSSSTMTWLTSNMWLSTCMFYSCYQEVRSNNITVTN